MNFDIKYLHENKPQAVVLLFHGLTGSPFELKKMAKALFNSGYDVYAETLAGHGEYSPDIKNVVWQDWQKQGKELVLNLKQRYDKVFISGLCLGAVLALNLSYELSNYIEAVVVLSPTLFLDGWSLPFYKFLFPIGLYTIVRYFYTFPEAEPYGIKNMSIRKKIKLLRQSNMSAMDNYPLCCVFELLKLSKCVQKNLFKITSPILIIHAKEDDLASPKSANVIFERVSSKIKEFILLENSYHLIVLDNEKEFVFEKTINFFKKCEVDNNKVLSI